MLCEVKSMYVVVINTVYVVVWTWISVVGEFIFWFMLMLDIKVWYSGAKRDTLEH